MRSGRPSSIGANARGSRVIRSGGARALGAILAALALGGCATSPPSDANNVCAIFEEKPDWYESAKDASERWGTPIHVQMAIIRQESAYRHDAKPPREKLLGFIPWFRPSSAYGYAQAKDGTWDWYIDDTGNDGADRDDFEDVADFVAWYVYKTHRMLGIPKWDGYRQYLAYHEGQGGYRRGSYRGKEWLMGVARRVDSNASHYHTQLSRCEDELGHPWYWPF